MKESDKKIKWKIIEINKQSIAHKTKKAYLIQLSSGIYKYYKFWYPKALLKNENNKLLLIYSDDFNERRKIFLDKNTENEMTISETVSLKLKLKEVPIVVLKHDIKKRISATIQFNRARGTH